MVSELLESEKSRKHRARQVCERFGERDRALVALFGVGLLTAIGAFCAAGSRIGSAAGDAHAGSALIDISVLVFREGLECILVLAAITASMVDSGRKYREAVAIGAGAAFLAVLVTWRIAVQIITDISGSIPALDVQAATGLLAVAVLLLVMNWFFHKIYWTGWISLHNRRKKDLLEAPPGEGLSEARILLGMGLLGFTSVYREGFEVVLFLQSYRLRVGATPVLYGTLLGLLLTATAAFLTFIAHRRLPYKRMLVLTGTLLGVVLLVMVGEQAQEMQQAHWIPATTITWLASRIPAWMSQWFSVFPTVETLAAQGLAAAAVIGSYVAARRHQAPRAA